VRDVGEPVDDEEESAFCLASLGEDVAVPVSCATSWCVKKMDLH